MLRRLLKALLKAESREGNGDAGNLRACFPGVEIAHPHNITLGERVSIGAGACLRASAPIVIGDDTMIAQRCIINTATHDPRNNPMWRVRVSRPIEIGSNVWLGSAAIVLPGLMIGHHAVVGAGAVVTAHVPERAVVVGNPAKIIRYRDVGPFDAEAAYPGKELQAGLLPPGRQARPADKSL